MTTLIDFYKNDATIKLLDGNELSLQQIIEADDAYWEECHNFIQWVLPNPNPSRYNPDAPLLTIAEAKQLSYIDILPNVRRFLEFLGIEYLEACEVCIISNPDRVNEWTKGSNHNKLRVTRLMIFLHCVWFCTKDKNISKLLDAISDCLNLICQYNQKYIDRKTSDFWLNNPYSVALEWYNNE